MPDYGEAAARHSASLARSPRVYAMVCSLPEPPARCWPGALPGAVRAPADRAGSTLPAPCDALPVRMFLKPAAPDSGLPGVAPALQQSPLRAWVQVSGWQRVFSLLLFSNRSSSQACSTPVMRLMAVTNDCQVLRCARKTFLPSAVSL